MSGASPAASADYAVGIVHYQSYELLDRCLASVEAQSLPPRGIFVMDLEGQSDRAETVRSLYPSSVWQAVPNVGYAAASNRCLALIAEHAPETRYALLLNADVELEVDFAANLVPEMDVHPEAVLGTGKLVRADGITLDSAGITLPRNRRPRDRGSDSRDTGQFDTVESVWGVSGAALFLRREAIETLEIEGELFDEDFYIYHEDTDLCWRAQNLGMQSLYVPAARAIHLRGWKRADRFAVAASLRRHSFKNHYLEILKNERWRDLVRNLPFLAGWEVLRLGHALVRDPAVLPGYLDAAKLAPRIWRKRRILEPRIRASASSR